MLTEHEEKSDGASEVHSVSVHKGVINQVEHLGRSFAAADRSNYNLAKPHDIIYTKSPTGDFPYGIVKQSRLPYNVIVSPLYGVFSPANRYLGYIFDAYFESPIRTSAYLAPITQKGAKNTIQISNATFLSKGLYLPDQEAEQQKIAECLGSLDELIAAENRKLDALKAHKKGLMQQLFPRPGESTPRLRFPEFQDAPEWEADKLGSVCELYQPVTLSASELSMTGEYLVYGANGIIGSHNKYNHEESEVAVTCRGATCGEVNRSQPKSWITGNAMVVKPLDTRLSRDFIFQYFKNHGLKSVISGSAQPQITRSGFAPLSVSFPQPAEQHLIAECLIAFDDQITAQTTRLATLRTHKQGLMQQLFPPSIEIKQ